jgi:hypothetical protein
VSDLGARVDEANRVAVGRMLAAAPQWSGVLRARHVVMDLGDREILLAGPPTSWVRATPGQRQAVVEAALFEGWADDEEEALALADSGAITLSSAHDRGGVAPAGIGVSASTPVLVIDDRTTMQRTWSAIDPSATSMAAARALEDVSQRRARHVFARDVLGPALDRAVDVAGSIELVPLLARALHRGDELGVRVEAAQSLLVSELSRHLVRAGLPRSELSLVLDHLTDSASTFAAVARGAAKSIAASASGVPGSTLVTAMAQGGRLFGVRVAGLGERWITTDLGAAALVDADLGDRAIAECVGLGAFALPAAPAVLAAFRGVRAEVPDQVMAMRSITVAVHPTWTVPLLDFEGVRIGIDVRRVVETGVAPLLAGEGSAKGELRTAPLACFVAALEAYAEHIGVQAS